MVWNNFKCRPFQMFALTPAKYHGPQFQAMGILPVLIADQLNEFDFFHQLDCMNRHICPNLETIDFNFWIRHINCPSCDPFVSSNSPEIFEEFPHLCKNGRLFTFAAVIFWFLWLCESYTMNSKSICVWHYSLFSLNLYEKNWVDCIRYAIWNAKRFYQCAKNVW